MLKKATLAILIASSILGTTVTLAGDKKVDKIITESMDKSQRIEKTITTDKSDTVGASYDVSMTTVVFSLNDKEINVFDNIQKINEELKQSNDITKTLKNYGKILSVNTKIQSVLEHQMSTYSQVDSLEYVNEVTNGVQSKQFLDIISYQKLYVNTLKNKQITLSMNIKDSELTSMSQVKVGEGSSESYLETPTITTVMFDQVIKLNTGEYKLVNLSGRDVDVKPLNEVDGNKRYKAVFIKVSEQSS